MIVNEIKEQIETLLYRIGFEKCTIQLARKTDDGQKELGCYKYLGNYSLITFLQHKTVTGVVKKWVLIEYARSLDEASKWMFDDGDMVPLDLPLKQILSELETEIRSSIDFAI